MINKLYIIGNGFDLHHNLNTSYNHFAHYLEMKDKELYDFLNNYINPKLENKLWSDFEENLANLDFERILFDYSHLLPDYSKEELRPLDREAFPYTMEDYLAKLTEGLIEEFQNFIREVLMPENATDLKLNIDKNAKFLSFNYTNTLETLYKIESEKIKYIHNSAHCGSEPIILGHGIDLEIFEEKLPEPPDDIELEDLEKWFSQNTYWDYSHSRGKETIKKYFEKNYKPTKFIIDSNQEFFSDLKSINEIYVLGHSLSKVDLPYFEKIIDSVSPSTKWFVAYYDDSERIKHLNTLKIQGLDERNINLFELINF